MLEPTDSLKCQQNVNQLSCDVMFFKHSDEAPHIMCGRDPHIDWQSEEIRPL